MIAVASIRTSETSARRRPTIVLLRENWLWLLLEEDSVGRVSQKPPSMSSMSRIFMLTVPYISCGPPKSEP